MTLSNLGEFVNRRQDVAWCWLERRHPGVIRATIRFYDRWLRIACGRRRVADVDGLQLHVTPGVAWPIRATHPALLDGIDDGLVVDVGCGSGYLSLVAASRGARVVALDVDPRARANALDNALRLDLGGRVTVQASDVLDGFTGEADWIISDPPWFLEELGARHRWTTHPDFVERLIAQAGERLRPGGELRLVVPSYQEPRIGARARARGWDVSTRRMPRREGLVHRARFLDFIPLSVIRLTR